MTIIEKILAFHSGKEEVTPGDIVDVKIDVRVARDFGGPGVVKDLQAHHLKIADPARTFFTFDCNPTGSDQEYAAHQHRCREFARQNHITVYDINSGIGTHLAIDEGLVVPGSTLVSTDSHANIVGAIGAFGQGMGDRDIAAAWSRGSVWFKVPESVKIIFHGERPALVSAKDMVLSLLARFGADGLLGYSLEFYGDEVDMLTLDERITIASMATEMGAIVIFFPPSREIVDYCLSRSYQAFEPAFADADAHYAHSFSVDMNLFVPMISRPGKPHDAVPVSELRGKRIDSAFVGSCTNGRLEDMRVAARILKGRKIAPGMVLKIVPATDAVWNACLQEGLIETFKSAGALFSNAGCAGCASGQVGQNGPGEKTISTGNRNFEGKQGKGEVYLASVATTVASAIAGHITTEDAIPVHPTVFIPEKRSEESKPSKAQTKDRPHILEGKVWLIMHDHVDTDMIYHNRHLAVTQIQEMGQYALGNLKGWEDFAKRAEAGDILICGKNFGAGSSRQHAVDCFRALGVQAILAESFGAIYERNAINAGFPVLTYLSIDKLQLKNRDEVILDLVKGTLTHKRSGKSTSVSAFSEMQKLIFEKGDLLLL
jgi:3-isopropylmalate dehydratase small subunit